MRKCRVCDWNLEPRQIKNEYQELYVASVWSTSIFIHFASIIYLWLLDYTSAVKRRNWNQIEKRKKLRFVKGTSFILHVENVNVNWQQRSRKTVFHYAVYPLITHYRPKAPSTIFNGMTKGECTKLELWPVLFIYFLNAVNVNNDIPTSLIKYSRLLKKQNIT